MTETTPAPAPRSFITGTVSPEGQISFRYNGEWSDLFTLQRLIAMAVDDQYREKQKNAAATPAPARPSFVDRRAKKGKKK